MVSTHTYRYTLIHCTHYYFIHATYSIMTLTCSRSKVRIRDIHTSLRPKFSSVSFYNELFSRYGTILGKVHQMTPNDLDMFKVKNTNMHTTYAFEAQIFVRFALWWADFELRHNFGNVHQMTPNDLDMFKVKTTNMHATYTPKAQISISFPLQWAVFELQSNFGKSASNNPKWPWQVQGQKYQYSCYTHP